MNLLQIGMITSASFSDVNNDSWPDLIVTGEWMPVKIFINNKGTFEATDLPRSTGLWQCVYPADVNGDGFTDILAGNWGHNSKLWAGKDGPCKLYIKDFDNNSSLEQILCYTINGNEYTFLAKDELERSLPVLKKAYLKYHDVAGKNVQYMFYDLFKNYVELKAEVLASSCFINDGQGHFNRVDLPEEFQLAPIFSFVETSPRTYLAAGNFYGVVPYEGRYDALLPTVFSYDQATSGFQLHLNLPVDGETRDAKWIKGLNDEKVLVLTRNNRELVFFKPLKEE
jgi:hypothetical protein